MRAQHTSGKSAYCMIFVVLAATMALISISGIGREASPMAALISIVCFGIALKAKCHTRDAQEQRRVCIVPPSCRLSERPQKPDRH